MSVHWISGEQSKHSSEELEQTYNMPDTLGIAIPKGAEVAVYHSKDIF